MGFVWSKEGFQLSVFCCQFSVIFRAVCRVPRIALSCQLSAISYQFFRALYQV